MDERQTTTDAFLEAHRVTNGYIETVPEMMQRAIGGFADAYAELSTRVQEALKSLEDEGPQLGDTKLSYKQLQRLTPAERADYARVRGKGKKR